MFGEVGTEMGEERRNELAFSENGRGERRTEECKGEERVRRDKFLEGGYIKGVTGEREEELTGQGEGDEASKYKKLRPSKREVPALDEKSKKRYFSHTETPGWWE